MICKISTFFPGPARWWAGRPELHQVLVDEYPVHQQLLSSCQANSKSQNCSPLRPIHTGDDLAFVPNRANELPLKCLAFRPLSSARIPIRGRLFAGRETRIHAECGGPQVIAFFCKFLQVPISETPAKCFSWNLDDTKELVLPIYALTKTGKKWLMSDTLCCGITH